MPGRGNKGRDKRSRNNRKNNRGNTAAVQSSRANNDVVALRAGTMTDDVEVDIQSIVPFEPYAAIVKFFNELMKDKEECTNLGYNLKHPAILVQKVNEEV